MLKILLVLGDQRDIRPEITKNDILVSRSLGARRFLIELTDIENPTPDEFRESLRSNSFDILIIVGHTSANDDGNDGTITINDGKDKNNNDVPNRTSDENNNDVPNRISDKNNNDVPDRISMNQYGAIFRESVENRRLKLVILAGCCSDGAARKLTMEGVPKVIAFRMPIAPSVVRVFFEELFRLWIKNSLNLQSAINRTRKHLKISDPDSPGASGTPILLTSNNAEQDPPLMFSEIARSSLRGRLLDPFLSIPLISTSLDRLIRLKYLQYLALFILASILAWACYLSTQPDSIACNIPNIENIEYISCGEKDMFHPDNKNYKKPDYTKDVDKFEQRWKESKASPQVQIAYSNAEAMAKLKEGKTIKTIAVMLPLSGDILKSDPDLPIGMLSAVAQYQYYWNHQDHPWKLQVMMVNDNNIEKDENPDKNKADDAVNFITKNQNILAVVGHYNSGTTVKYIEKYDTEKLTLISGTNTVPYINRVKEKNKKTSKPSNYYFRNTTTTDFQSEKLTDYLKEKLRNINRAYIIAGKGTYATAYDNSLRKSKGITIPKTMQLESIENKDMRKVASQIVRNNPQAVIIIPNPFVENNTQALINLISNINNQSPQCLIIGTETLTRNSFWQYLNTETDKIKDLNLLLSLPFVPGNINSLDLSFLKTPIFHRAILTYDSMKVLIDAIDRAANDEKVKNSKSNVDGVRSTLPEYIRQITKEKDYKGITGAITFNNLGDREQLSGTIAKVKFNKETKKIELTQVND
jgi:branched-chain amino acid transport system substrate-binding protein